MKTQMALPGNPTPAEEVRRVRVVRDAIGPDITADVRYQPALAARAGDRYRQPRPRMSACSGSRT